MKSVLTPCLWRAHLRELSHLSSRFGLEKLWAQFHQYGHNTWLKPMNMDLTSCLQKVRGKAVTLAPSKWWKRCVQIDVGGCTLKLMTMATWQVGRAHFWALSAPCHWDRSHPWWQSNVHYLSWLLSCAYRRGLPLVHFQWVPFCHTLFCACWM